MAEPSASQSLDLTDDAIDFSDSPLHDAEIWWRDHQVWLAERGYMLRPRYRQDWVPSWKAQPCKDPWNREDWISIRRPFILDATRISDKKLVMLKKVKKSWNPQELDMAQYVSSDDFCSDPRNHCVALLDTLPVPNDSDVVIIVMPLLRACDSPPWTTVGEVVSFVQQIFEGLEHMHEHHMAHRDCMPLNIMYDPLPIFPKMFHPRQEEKRIDLKGSAKYSTRTLHPVKYYYIDFGLSTKYNPEDGPPREHPIRGGDKTVPEFQNWKGELLDPFPTDVYYLGNAVREKVLQEFRNVDFIEALIQDMTQTDPSKRPTMPEVMRRFKAMLKDVNTRTLRSRLVPRSEDPDMTGFYNFLQRFRTMRYILWRKSAIPLPP